MTISDDILFTPPDVARMVVDDIRSRVSHPGRVQVGIKEVDDYVIPPRPGDLITIIGRPQNYKSGLSQWIARVNAGNLVKDGEKEVVVYCTWEQTVEQMAMYEIASWTGIPVLNMARGSVNEEQMRVIINATKRRATIPIYIIGHSASVKRRRPGLTLDAVAGAIDDMASGKVLGDRYPPRMIILDYLQRIRHSREQSVSQRRIRMMEIVDAAKDMALSFGCPVILPCQAKREVDSRQWQLPTMADGEETANIEQASDKVLTVMMPKVYYPAGATVGIGGYQYTVSDNMLVLSVAKQKDGPAGRVFVLRVDPGRNIISGLYQ